MYSRAGSMPPISSTTRSLRSTMSSKSPRLRVSTPTTSGRLPVVASIAPARCSISSWRADPTVPWPSRPTLKLDVTEREVVVGLAANHDASVAAGAEDHGRARDAVVVVGHRVTVGAGGGGHEHIAGARIVEQHVGHEDVARLAVLARHRAQRVAPEAVRDLGLV